MLDILTSVQRVLRIFPDCPGPVRLGIGQCQYKMGRFEKARKAFERVVQASTVLKSLSQAIHHTDCPRITNS